MRRLLTTLTTVVLVWTAWAEEKQKDSLEGMIERTMPLKTHSIAPPYVDSDLQNRWWDFGADTVINTAKQVRLTQDKPSQSGWLWSRMPLSLNNFQVDIEFKVDGKAHNMFGDGFAVWISKDRAQYGPVFGSVDKFDGLGIFFDTYANSRHSYKWPRVTAMLGDGKTEYDNAGDNAAHELAACSENFRRRDIPTKARITYIKNRLLQLKLQTTKEDQWTVCFEAEVDLPPQPYLGFSALTGDVSDNHDIVSVSTYTVHLKSEYRDEQKPFAAGSAKRDARKRADKGGSASGAAGWFLFILKIIGLLAFIAFVVAAYRTYTAQQSRKAW